MIYLLIFFQSVLFSKGLQISSELDTNNVYVGEVLRWSIKVEGHENINYNFPDLNIDNDSIKVKQIVSSENKIIKLNLRSFLGKLEVLQLQVIPLKY